MIKPELKEMKTNTMETSWAFSRFQKMAPQKRNFSSVPGNLIIFNSLTLPFAEIFEEDLCLRVEEIKKRMVFFQWLSRKAINNLFPHLGVWLCNEKTIDLSKKRMDWLRVLFQFLIIPSISWEHNHAFRPIIGIKPVHINFEMIKFFR